MNNRLSANLYFTFSSPSYYYSFGYLTLNQNKRISDKWAA
jgi:hypothetical protein